MAGKNTTTIDFGSTPVNTGTFVVTDAAITTTTEVEAFVVVDSTGDNSQENHRHAAASWQMSVLPGTGNFTLYVDCLIDLCWGTFKIRYAYA